MGSFYIKHKRVQQSGFMYILAKISICFHSLSLVCSIHTLLFYEIYIHDRLISYICTHLYIAVYVKITNPLLFEEIHWVPHHNLYMHANNTHQIQQHVSVSCQAVMAMTHLPRCLVLSCLVLSSLFAPEGGLGLTLGSVFACHLFKRGD